MYQKVELHQEKRKHRIIKKEVKNNIQLYIAACEEKMWEIGRLMAGLPQTVRGIGHT